MDELNNRHTQPARFPIIIGQTSVMLPIEQTKKAWEELKIVVEAYLSCDMKIDPKKLQEMKLP